ncbi:hypothetical protein ACH5RR_037616 [Cinchona calisaya]|uniref:Uncharacterized protein n=1 Tax=Cinchona calisaya TaxID=153742 RepID=A0ABD2Y9S2_9GENT
MWLAWRKELLDLILLVPVSLFIMFGYHLFLHYRYLRFPNTTIIGHENHNKRAWIERMMEIDATERPALLVIGHTMSAASTLSSISLVISSLIGARLGSSNRTVFTGNLIYGDTGPSVISASYLMTMPNADIPVGYIEKEVIRGSNFWEFGPRALYIATIFLFWVFGPIPMFISSVVMVGLLHKLDTNKTPLYQYQYPRIGHDFLKKVGQNVSTVTKGVAHHGTRPHGRK